VQREKFKAVTPAFIQVLLRELAEGKSLRKICQGYEGAPSEGVTRQAIYENYMDLAAQYALARDIGLDCRADAILDIAADGSQDTYVDDDGNVRVDKEIVARSRLRVDTERWYLSKLASKRYGDRLDVTNSDGTLKPMSDTERSAKLAALLGAAQSRAAASEDGSDLA
jgi:hypothetical protein